MTLIASSEKSVIQKDSKVSLHFSLILEGGEEIDSTRTGPPATFILGDGSLLPGFENVLVGLGAGDSEQILIPASEAFGEKNDQNIRIMKQDLFKEIDASKSLEIGLIVSFDGPGGELPGVIVDIASDVVKVDFNHPLAGKDILFDFSILSVTDTGIIS